MQLQPGQLISAPFLPATAEIKKFELRTGYALLEVVLHDGHQTYKPLRITPDQLAQIEIIDHQEAAVAANAEDFFFFIEANRIRLAYQFDPQLAVSISQVDPLPHQIEAVYHYVLNSPRVRFLIADDPGAGKTIMTGLFIKELMLPGDPDRCLVVASGNLVEQWQDELYQRFQLPFELLTNDRITAARTGNALKGKRTGSGYPRIGRGHTGRRSACGDFGWKPSRYSPAPATPPEDPKLGDGKRDGAGNQNPAGVPHALLLMFTRMMLYCLPGRSQTRPAENAQQRRKPMLIRCWQMKANTIAMLSIKIKIHPIIQATTRNRPIGRSAWYAILKSNP